MIDYMQHLYNYCDISRRSPNRKLLRNWIRYIEEHDIPDEECYGYTVDFLANDLFMEGKTKSTRRNYNSELNRFCEYVYGCEGWVLPWNRTDNVDEEPEEPERVPIVDGVSTWDRLRSSLREDVDVVVDDEYRAFLEKYERLSQE